MACMKDPLRVLIKSLGSILHIQLLVLPNIQPAHTAVPSSNIPAQLAILCNIRPRRMVIPANDLRALMACSVNNILKALLQALQVTHMLSKHLGKVMNQASPAMRMPSEYHKPSMDQALSKAELYSSPLQTRAKGSQLPCPLSMTNYHG